MGKSTTTLSEYKSAADSSQRRADALQAELQEVREQQATEQDRARTAEESASKEIAGLRAKVAILQDMVTGQSAIEKLTGLTQGNADGIAEIKELLRKTGNGSG